MSPILIMLLVDFFLCFMFLVLLKIGFFDDIAEKKEEK